MTHLAAESRMPIIGYRKNGAPIRVIAGGAKGNAKNLPTDEAELGEFLATQTNEQLEEMRDQLTEKFNSIYGEDGSGVDSDGFDKLSLISDQIKAIRDVESERATEQAARTERLNAMHNEIHGDNTEDEDGPESKGEESEDSDDVIDDDEENSDSTEFTNVLSAAVSSAVGSTIQKLIPAENLIASGNVKDVNKRLRLGSIANYAPDAKVPVKRSEMVITASADIPGFQQGSQIGDLEKLGEAMHKRARSLPVTRTGAGMRATVASLQRDFRFKLNSDSTPSDINEVLKAATDPDILVAAGGWCAPSEITYDFYNIVCEDGMVDIPNIGVLSRGGIQYPVSPTFSDIYNASPNGLWTWTEEDDIDALTSDSVLKTCVRVPCPDFTEARLVCEGLCITAGNLVDFAYPELVANFVRLLTAARSHQTNIRLLNLMVNGGGGGDGISASTTVDHTGLLGASTAALLNSVELSAIDYRAKYRMCETDVLEVILPNWAKGTIRADLANRNGVEMLAVTDAMIADWFNMRGVSVQFVSDWQLTALGQDAAATGYPATVQYLIYAAGTFVRGSGLSLDLGVVRDSVLNETNDHTAAWMEDCYLVAKPGHESRLVTVNTCLSGETGQLTLSCGA